MIYLRFQDGSQGKYGILDGKTVYEITPNFYGLFKKTGKKYPLSKIKLLPPCQPGKVVALGLNYLAHIKEMKASMPMQPVIFMKPPSSVIGPNDLIVYPVSSGRVEYEAELGIVIKKKAKNIPARKSPEYILGYTCVNDVTARDLQKIDGQWTRSKSFDTFCPIGPWIADDIDPNDLRIETLVNGKVKQKANTDDLIFKIDEIVSFVSQVMTLNPGDVIATGTPPGVGPIVPGDKVEVKIQDIGTLTNKVIAQQGR